MSDGRSVRRGSLPVLRHRDFAIFFTAASISNAAVWMQTIAVPALLFDLTGKATWLGIASLATLVPQVIILPWSGVLADRVSRRKILLFTQTASMVVTFSLWGLYVGDGLTPWWIVGLGFVNGLAGGFQHSTWQAFIPLLAPPEEVLDAVKLNSVQFTLARAIGPAVAGIVLARWGSGVAIFVNATTFLLVIVVLVAVRPREAQTIGRDTRVLAALADGARFVWHNLAFRTAVTVAFVGALGAQSLWSLAPALSKRTYGRTSDDSSWLLTSLGVGAIVAFICWTVFGERLRRSRQVLLGLTGYTISAAIVAAGPTFEWALLGFFVGGLAHLTTSVGISTLLQGQVPEMLRARVMSFYLIGIISGIPLGTYGLGWLGDALSLRWALAVDVGVMGLVICSLVASRWIVSLDVTSMSGELSVVVANRTVTDPAGAELS